MRTLFPGLRILGLALLLAAPLASAPPAGGLSFACSVSQGFNFQKNSQNLIGHINSLKVGDTKMDSDLNVTDPMNIANFVKVFGIASDIHWNGGYAQPVAFSAQVSVANKNKLATLQHKSMANTEVEVQFTIYAFDPKAKAYYRCFHTNSAKVKGLVLKQGGGLAMKVAMDQSVEVVSPKNYAFQLGIMPQDTAMQLFFATSAKDQAVLPWGVQVAK